MKHIEYFCVRILLLRTQACCSRYASSGVDSAFLDGLDLEMESDEGEHQALQVLDQVIETAEPIWIPGLVHINQTANLAGCERDVLVADDNLQLLTANSVWLRPKLIIFGHDLTILNDPPQLIHDSLMGVCLLADHCVILVVAVVCISELAIWPELKLQKLVSKLSLVTDIIAQVEVVGHSAIS